MTDESRLEILGQENYLGEVITRHQLLETHAYIQYVAVDVGRCARLLHRHVRTYASEEDAPNRLGIPYTHTFVHALCTTCSAMLSHASIRLKIIAKP